MSKQFGIAWCLGRCLLAIAVAVVVTGGTGWGFAAWEQRKAGAYANVDGPNVWARSRVEGFKDPLTTFVNVAIGAPQARHDRSKFGTSLVLWESGVLQPTETRLWRFGWPVNCLEFSETFSSPYSNRPARKPPLSVWIGGWEIEPVAGWKVILPLRVRGWELAADVGVWSAVFGALFVGVPVARLILRRRRGMCVACGYDLRSLGLEVVCPECGHRRASALGTGA